MDYLLCSLRHLFQLRLFWLEMGTWRTEKGDWNDPVGTVCLLAHLLLLLRSPKETCFTLPWHQHLQLWAVSLHRPGWWGPIMGWVLLYLEVRYWVVMSPRLLIAFNTKPAVPARGTDTFLSWELLPLSLVQSCVLSTLLTLMLASWALESVLAFAQYIIPSRPLQLPSRV